MTFSFKYVFLKSESKLGKITERFRILKKKKRKWIKWNNLLILKEQIVYFYISDFQNTVKVSGRFWASPEYNFAQYKFSYLKANSANKVY